MICVRRPITSQHRLKRAASSILTIILTKVELQLNLGDTLYDPMDFVDAVSYAEEVGFKTAWLGDHFVPWYHAGKRSAFVWSVVPVALERTNKIRVGPLVATPIGARYQPAIVAQAAATLDNMYPGRFLLSVGTGEAINEAQFWKGRWPNWKERMDRLSEGTDLIRRLLDSAEPFEFKGKYFPSEFNFLYTKPKTRVPIYFSALGRRGGYYAGRHGDSLLTISPRASADKLQESILPAYRKGCKDAGKKPGTLSVLVVESFMDPEEYRQKHWRSLGWMLRESWGLDTPLTVERKGKDVTLKRVKEIVHFCKGWKDLIRVVESYTAIGATEIILDSKADKDRIRQYAKNLLDVF